MRDDYSILNFKGKDRAFMQGSVSAKGICNVSITVELI